MKLFAALTSLFFAANAHAGAVVQEEAPADVLTGVIGSAEAMPSLSSKTYRWLKPKHHLLGARVRNNTDYTAYTLEMGELKVGIAAVSLGIAPRTQLGTVPLLNALGVYNGSIKVNPVRVGPWDLSLSGTHHRLPMGDFVGSYSSVGAQTSLAIHSKWSIHAGATYTHAKAAGIPDFSKLSPMLTSLTRGELSDLTINDEWFDGETPSIKGEVVSVRVATDFRFNRRDSIILQASAIVWARTEAELPFIPPVLNLDKALQHDGKVPIKDTYVASLAYQASWKQVDFRVGVGLSAVPYAWLMQSMELSYRFGGKSRRTESRQRKAWRKNKGDVGESPV
jgi:hypothetical protein